MVQVEVSQALERLLAEAAAHESAGARGAAQNLFLQVLRRDPANVTARFGLARQLLGNDRLADGIAQLRRVLKHAPGLAPIHAALGRALRRSGDLAGAAAALTEAIRLDPAETTPYCDLAACQRALGRAVLAEATLRQALAHCGERASLLGNLGIVLAERGQRAAAIEALARALILEGDSGPAAALLHGNLAKAHVGAGDVAAGERHYRAAVAALPDFADAHHNLGILLKSLGRTAEAAAAFDTALRLTRASRWIDAAAPERRDRSANFTTTTEAKLVHDIEQFHYLSALGRLPPAFRPTIARFEAGLAELRGAKHDGRIVPLPAGIAELEPQAYGRLVHLAPAPALAESPLNPALDGAAIEAAYFANPPGLAAIDDFLTAEALASLRRFCLESTVWFDFSHPGGYLGAYMDDGFCCGLLLQIAEDLRRRFPAVFRDHALKQMWAYKYDSRLTGIATHADAAAVNVNFWITPDAANLDPAGGGLEVHMREAPAEWDFAEYNGDDARIRAFLERHRVACTVIPHRQNRAVMFNSNLFHQTGRFHFKPGYENRRINVTMLFGDRLAPAVPPTARRAEG